MSNVTQLKSSRREVKRWVETLGVKLSPEEKWDSAMRAAELACLVARLEEEKKFAATEFAEKIKKAKADLLKEAVAASTGTAQREVSVVEEFDTFDNEVVRIRQDSGEMIGRRRATDSERQGSLNEVAP